MIKLLLSFLFWANAGCVLYSYFVYPLLLLILAALKQIVRDLRYLSLRRDRRIVAGNLPTATMLVAAYNEEGIIEEKLANTSSLQYPTGRLHTLLGIDASSDSTAERAHRARSSTLEVVPFAIRRGKLAVINDLASRATSDILVFSDANTLIAPDALIKLARHFEDPKVGAVVGEIHLFSRESHTRLESLYWKYEIALKVLESRLNCLVGVNGGLYAVRRSLFHLEPEWITEDFQLPVSIRYAGHRLVYEPEAVAREEVAPNSSVEFRRRIRIGAGDYQTMLQNLRYLNPFKGLITFSYVSHKVLRWLGPLFLIVAFLSSAALMSKPVYLGMFAAQCLFYTCGLVGWRFQKRERTIRLFYLCYYFSVMNLALLIGMIRYLSGSQKAVWNVTPRSQSSSSAAVVNGAGL